MWLLLRRLRRPQRVDNPRRLGEVPVVVTPAGSLEEALGRIRPGRPLLVGLLQAHGLRGLIQDPM